MIAIAAVFAGLALFIAGMNTMSRGLQAAAGRGLRRSLERATTRRGNGLLLGTVLGFLIQSSAGTVMLVGFISAGLLTLAQAIPVVLGINIGTSLSMLLISFRLGDACWAAIAAGLAVRALRPQSRAGAVGLALFGFGVIFLGLTMMSDAIRPYRAELAPLLRYADGSSFAGMVTGVAAATVVTAVIQSSGAVIGMVFAMIAAGAVTGLEQAWPIIIGANIGTCATALLGSIGTSPAARRSALSHLVFNLFSAAAGMAAAPLVYRYIPLLRPVTAGVSIDVARQALIQQCAMANVLKMVITAVVALPFSPWLGRAVTHLGRGRSAGSPSLLDTTLLDRPEAALQAALAELSRLSGICRDSLRRQAWLYLGPDARRQSAVLADEIMLDTLKLAMHDYLQGLFTHSLSRRQGILLSLLYTGIDHLERISDHVARMAEVSQAHRRHPEARFIPESLDAFLDLNQKACAVLTRLQQALAPGVDDRRAAAEAVIAARDRYMALADRQREQIASDLSSGRSTASAVLYRNSYLSHLNRIVKHAKTIALATRDRDFHIKPVKLERRA
jgi:phosphate:Na+ symporter